VLADCAYPARTEALPGKLLRGIHHHPGVLVRFELGQGVVGVPAVPSSNRIALASVYQVFGPSPTPRQWRAGLLRTEPIRLPRRLIYCSAGHLLS
jgi:hypothetical protein